MGTTAKSNPHHQPWNSRQGIYSSCCNKQGFKGFVRFKRSKFFNQGFQGMLLRSVVNGEAKTINGCCCCCSLGKVYDVAEEDQRFVAALREAQSYVYLHRGSTFVLLLSAEIVASSYLDAILKVSQFLSFSKIFWVNISWRPLNNIHIAFCSLHRKTNKLVP